MKRKIQDRFQQYWCYLFRHTRKNNHIVFFLKSAVRRMTPRRWLRKRLGSKLNSFYKLPIEEQRYIKERVDYYCKFKQAIPLPDDAAPLSTFTYKQRESYVHDYVNSTYFFDAYQYTRYFDFNLRWAYNPGDVNYMFPVPEITKSRPLLPGNDNRNNILLNLDKVRHFMWVDDPFEWHQKMSKVIFRGNTFGKPRREDFINKWKDNPLCNLLSTNTESYSSERMSIYDHLRFRYIMALEGNDVASNLKWVMSSNSIAVMPRPTCETWFMEGLLIPNYHYIEIADDFHDLEERIEYYEKNPNEAAAIVRHAHEWVRQFRNQEREDLISLMVLDKYFRLTGQKDPLPRPTVKSPERQKYFINEKVKLASYEKVNAQGKARKDVLHTFSDLGYTEHDIVNYKYSLGEGKRYHHYPYFSDYMTNNQVRRFVKKVQFGDTIVIQDFYRKYMQLLAKECMKREAIVIFVVHDVQSIRYNTTSKEMRKLNNASLLLVHTQAMADKLKSLGVTTPMRIMWLFDYYSDDPLKAGNLTRNMKKRVVFAGNLSKSAFLHNLVKQSSFGGVKFRLYGMKDNSLNLDNNPNIKYCGVFEPERTGKITGGWGLVWDGDSIDTCSGDYGEYLRYNSSHKTSLYLASGIPIIVWEQSSLASWVKEKKVGIIVSSLNEIGKVINELTEEEYTEIIINARYVGKSLRKGEFLKAALNMGSDNG